MAREYHRVKNRYVKQRKNTGKLKQNAQIRSNDNPTTEQQSTATCNHVIWIGTHGRCPVRDVLFFQWIWLRDELMASRKKFSGISILQEEIKKKSTSCRQCESSHTSRRVFMTDGCPPAGLVIWNAVQCPVKGPLGKVFKYLSWGNELGSVITPIQPGFNTDWNHVRNMIACCERCCVKTRRNA